MIRMMIKAQSLKVGQTISVLGTPETISSIEDYGSGVMVYFESAKDNPFVSSNFASYSISTLVEVL